MAYIFAEMSESHRRAVIDIFNYFITESHAAFLTEAVDYPFFDHFLKMAHGYPALVVQAGRGQVVGFGFLRPHYLADSLQKSRPGHLFYPPGLYPAGAGHCAAGFFRGEGPENGPGFIVCQCLFPQP